MIITCNLFVQGLKQEINKSTAEYAHKEPPRNTEALQKSDGEETGGRPKGY